MFGLGMLRTDQDRFIIILLKAMSRHNNGGTVLLTGLFGVSVVVIFDIVSIKLVQNNEQ